MMDNNQIKELLDTLTEYPDLVDDLSNETVKYLIEYIKNEENTQDNN